MLRQTERPRGIVLALALSLGLNLFFAAFVTTQAWRAWHTEEALPLAERSSGNVGMRGVLQQIIAILPPEDGRLLRKAFAARIPELIAWRRQSAAAMDQVRADIAQQPFDLERTRVDITSARDARQKLAPIIEEALLTVLPDMSDAGRRALGKYRLMPR